MINTDIIHSFNKWIIIYGIHFSLRFKNIVYSVVVVPFFPFCPLHLAHPSSHSQSSLYCPRPFIIHTCSLTNNPFLFLPSFHPPSSPPIALFFYGSIFLITLFCSLVSGYKWGLWYDLTDNSFTNWLILLSMIVSSSIHGVTKGRTSFFLLCGIPLYKWNTIFLSTYLMMGTWAVSNT